VQYTHLYSPKSVAHDYQYPMKQLNWRTIVFLLILW